MESTLELQDFVNSYGLFDSSNKNKGVMIILLFKLGERGLLF